MNLFAVIRTQGGAWRQLTSLEDQPDWTAHAAFMNGLERDGFVLLGGPLDGTPDVLLIVRASTSEQIIERLAADPWTVQDLLRVSRITPWEVRLGSLP